MTTEQPIVSRQRRKKDITHKSIMHSAKSLFEHKGIGSVTIEEITEAADVSRSTFFSHFVSLEALSTEIAGVAIEEILEAHASSGKSGIPGIMVLINKLIDDTCPYPYLTTELLMNGIVKSRGKSPFYYFENLITNELKIADISEESFTHKEWAALILGAYFGLIFQKLIKGETFNNPEEIKKTMRNYINKSIGGNL